MGYRSSDLRAALTCKSLPGGVQWQAIVGRTDPPLHVPSHM
jgi:hypothetical protein